MKDYALKTANTDAQRITDMVAEHISTGITEHQRAVQLLAGNESILTAIRTPNPKNPGQGQPAAGAFQKNL